jgi:2-methylcitrate dehydratase PrpD
MAGPGARVPRAPAMLSGFIHDLTWDEVPAPVRERVALAVVDTVAVGCAGARLPIARAWAEVANGQLGAGRGPQRGEGTARVLGVGGRAGIPVAAMVGAGLVDAYDAHDGHPLCKGHAGATVVPVALAHADAAADTDWRELLLRVLVGYEVATRAGIVLHATAAVHHSSGAWNALGAAAVGARALRLGAAETDEALGVAEYYGPRSPLLRVARHPTMVKDGSALGAFAGALAAHLAAAGFTGAPAELVTDPHAESTWLDLGRRWRVLETYVKPWPVCRWVQPAVEAVLALRRRAGSLDPGQIEAVTVHTFGDAVALDCARPTEADAAQYSLPFAVAVAATHGRIDAGHLADAGLADPAVLGLASRVTGVVDPGFDALYPAQRWARVEVRLRSGEVLTSDPHTTRGDPERPLGAEEVEAKIRSAAAPLGPERTDVLWSGVHGPAPRLPEFLDAVLG